MSNERIDLTKELEWLHEHRGDRSVGTISKHDVVVETDYIEGLIAELKRCYEKIDWLQQVADLAADNIGRKNWDGFEEAMYEAGLWERPSE